MENEVVLVAFYNEKALGVRYLANALEKSGYHPHIICIKTFHSKSPKKVTDLELSLLQNLIQKIQPIFIGLSVMSSCYLETVQAVNAMLRENFSIPIIWGGVYATLEPKRCAKECSYVMRGEGEETIVEIADLLQKHQSLSGVMNLAYWDGPIYMENEIRPLYPNIDRYGYPSIGRGDIYLIHHNKIRKRDPLLSSFTYELSASRGCPFSCSYCSSVNLRRLYTGKGPFLRFRKVDSVIQELKEAKEKIPHLKVIHFWDEIFSDEQGWIEEFASRYQKEIRLPFRIWGHPLKIEEKNIALLVQAGLYQISVGIQSGSPEIRKKIFHRSETQDQIIRTSKILSRCKVPSVYYDLMICHPFESLDQLKETYRLCMQLEPPFKLNIHGLNFLPATDIVTMALDRKLYTREQVEQMMYCSLKEQYDRYWGPNARSFHDEAKKESWCSLIFLTQFPEIRDRVEDLAILAETKLGEKEIFQLKHRMEYRFRFHVLKEKVLLSLKSR